MQELQILNWYEKWLTAHSNNYYDQYYRIEIKTIDNPGWSVVIDLEETELSGASFDEIRNLFDDENWINCFVKDDVFYGNGDPTKLTEILYVFKEWAAEILGRMGG